MRWIVFVLVAVGGLAGVVAHMAPASGQADSEAVHNTCFGCHATVKTRDFVFNRYAP